MDKQAKISLGVEGADAARRAATDIETAWTRSARTIGTAWSGMGRAIGSQISQTVSDVSRIALAVDAIDFAGAIKGAIDLQASLERMAVGAGRGAGDLKSKFTAIGDKIGEQPNKVAAWSRALNRTVYDFDKTSAAAEGLGAMALRTGRTLEEMLDLGGVVGRSSKSVEDLGRTLGVVGALAAKLGKEKGAALVGTVAGAAAPGVGKFAPDAISTPGGLTGQTAAIQAQLIEQGLDPQQAADVTQTMIADMTQNVSGIELQQGKKFGSMTDRFGRLKQDPLSIMEMQQEHIRKIARTPEEQKYIASNVFGGAMAGGGVMGIDFKKVRASLAAAGAAPEASGDPLKDLPTVADENKIASNKRKAAEAAQPAVQAARGFSAEHPYLSMAADTVTKLAVPALVGMIAKVGVAKSIAAVGSALAAPVVAVTAAGLAGAGAMHAIDESNLLTDRLGVALAGGDWTSQGRYAQGIRNGEGVFVNEAQTHYAESPEAQALIQQQMETTRRRNQAGPEQDPTAFLFPSSVDSYGVPTSASGTQPLDSATIGAEFKRALDNSEIKIVLFNNTSDPNIAVSSDKANAKAQN